MIDDRMLVLINLNRHFEVGVGVPRLVPTSARITLSSEGSVSDGRTESGRQGSFISVREQWILPGRAELR